MIRKICKVRKRQKFCKKIGRKNFHYKKAGHILETKIEQQFAKLLVRVKKIQRMLNWDPVKLQNR
jgi:hypothetical protein